ncbi:23154_t:CDS:2, partial [Dentiscutata erythropus]
AKKVVDITKQREKPSATINCEWHVNFNNCKETKEIICTSFVDKHNYEMNPLVAQTAPLFRKLSEEMIEDVRFYTCSTEGIGATLQYNFLKAKYPDKYINKKDVYNAIQRFRVLRNTILLHLVDAIQNKLNEEARYTRINEQKNTNPTIGLPHVAATELSFDWNKDFVELENVMEDGCIKDDYEQRQTGLRSLLQTLKDLISLHPPIRLCEANQPSLSDNNIYAINFEYLAQLCTSNVLTSTLKKSNSEKSCWSKGYEISKKVLNLMICLNCNNKFLQMMEEFISLKTRELELLENRKENEKENDKENDKKNSENVIESQQYVVANPYVTKRHSRPPKCFKDALENITNTCQTVVHNKQCERKRNKCNNCGDYGHN